MKNIVTPGDGLGFHDLGIGKTKNKFSNVTMNR